MGTIQLLGQIFDKVLSTITVDSLSVSGILAQTEYIDILKSTIHYQTILINVALGVIASFVVLVVISQYKFWEKLRKFEKEITKYDEKFDSFKEWKNIEDNFRGFLSDSKGLTEYDRTVYLDKILRFVINNKDIVESIFFFSIYDTLDKMIEKKKVWEFLRADRFEMKITEIKEIYPGGTIENKCNKFLDI